MSDVRKSAEEALAEARRRMIGTDTHVRLWKAINDHSVALASVTRMETVVRVETALFAYCRAILAEAGKPAGAGKTCLCPWPEQDAAPRHRPGCGAPQSDGVAEARTRYATRPSRGDNRVPYCDEQCPQHDGKRCRIMGCRPSSICEPEVLNLLADLDASEKARKVAEEERTIASAQLDRLLALPEVEAPESGYEDVADAVEAAFNELREERDAEQSRQERAIAIVSRLQFCVPVVEGFGPVERDLCPECDQVRERGHSPDCPIGRLLSDQPSAGEPAVAPEVHVPRAGEAP